jgi:uncharacterized protein YecT (DUF1311 family)
MRTAHTITLLLALGLTTGAAAAAVDCDNAASTVDINECAARDQKAVEVKLNTAYQAALKSLGDGEGAATKKALVLAQRAWIKFREADCKALYELWSGGTMRDMVFLNCMRRRAEQRIKELDEFENPH